MSTSYTALLVRGLLSAWHTSGAVSAGGKFGPLLHQRGGALGHRTQTGLQLQLQPCGQRLGTTWARLGEPQTSFGLRQAAHRQYVTLRGHMTRFEQRLTAFVNGASISSDGQKALLSLIPVAVLSQLFPGRFQALALSPQIVTKEQWATLRQPRHASLIQQLLGRMSLPVFVRQLIAEVQIALRAMYLALLFSPALLLGPAAFWAGGQARAAWMQLICWCLERAGPAFIKWGQWSSTRPDLFPPDLCTAMERLQSSAPSHAPAYSHTAITTSLRMPVDELFDSFEDEPVASGSIAQIHRAQLSHKGAALTNGRYRAGTTVAVKVRHPGVTQLMEHDFILMERAARAVSTLPGLRDLRLEESIRQFGGPLKEQLDLRVEASHLTRFKRNFRLWPNVTFPAPLYPLVSSDVLVETFEDGALISKYVNQPAYAHRHALAETGLLCYLQMLLRDNFIHADLHPGNILVKEPPAAGRAAGGLRSWYMWLRSWMPLAPAPPQLVLLDTGMIAELSKADQQHLIRFFRALTKQDGELVGNAILDMSERYTCKDPDAFVDRVKALFDRLDPEYIHKHTADVIQTIIETIREHQVTLRSAVSTVVVTTLVLEGWSSKLNPQMRILDHMRDMLVVDWNERIGRAVDNVMRSGSLAVV